MMKTASSTREFWHGVRGMAPLLLGVVPFGVIFGALARHIGLNAMAAQAMSSVIFAGSSQFIAAQLIGAGASGLIVVLVIVVVNLRHALYSASIAPHVRHLGRGWKLLLSYLLTDEAYAVSILHYCRDGGTADRHWYLLGSGLTLWASWQASTAAGILLGEFIPRSWPLGFASPLIFISLVVPAIKDRAAVGAAVAAGAVSLLALGLPYRTGLLLAAAAGILAGLGLEAKKT